MLLAVATTVRTFLLPHWQRWHDAWGPPAPMTLSQWTCVRSSLLLARALEQQGIRAALQSGRPLDDAICVARDGYGLLTADGWVSHAWVKASGYIIDITADQFGQAPVVVTSVDDAAYRRGEHPTCRLMPTHAGLDAVEEIWPSWCSYVDRHR